MKVDNRTPSQQSDLTLMNARRKEKREQLWNNRKPKTKSEWVALGELLIIWSKESDSISIDDFGIKYNYGPHRIAKWTKDSEEFMEAWETATYNVGQRRNKLWKDTDKILNRTLPLYDWNVRDYEEKVAMMKKESESILRAGQPIMLYEPLKIRIPKQNKKDKE